MEVPILKSVSFKNKWMSFGCIFKLYIYILQTIVTACFVTYLTISHKLIFLIKKNFDKLIQCDLLYKCSEYSFRNVQGSFR